VFGALIIVPLSELLRGLLSQSTSGLHLVIYGIIVIVVILYFPSGVSGAIGRAASRFSSAGAFAARVQVKKYDAEA
jgi:branched-chain amino acid transport system permease protein